MNSRHDPWSTVLASEASTAAGKALLNNQEIILDRLANITDMLEKLVGRDQPSVVTPPRKKTIFDSYNKAPRGHWADQAPSLFGLDSPVPHNPYRYKTSVRASSPASITSFTPDIPTTTTTTRGARHDERKPVKVRSSTSSAAEPNPTSGWEDDVAHGQLPAFAGVMKHFPDIYDAFKAFHDDRSPTWSWHEAVARSDPRSFMDRFIISWGLPKQAMESMVWLNEEWTVHLFHMLQGRREDEQKRAWLV